MAAFESPVLPSVPPLPLRSLPAQSALTLALNTKTHTREIHEWKKKCSGSLAAPVHQDTLVVLGSFQVSICEITVRM